MVCRLNNQATCFAEKLSNLPHLVFREVRVAQIIDCPIFQPMHLFTSYIGMSSGGYRVGFHRLSGEYCDSPTCHVL